MTGSSIGSSGSLFFGGMLLSSLTSGGLATLVPEGWAPWQVVFACLAAPGLLVAALVLSLKEPPRRGLPAAARRDAPKLRIVDWFRRFPATLTLFFGGIALYSFLVFAMGAWTPTLLIRVYGMKPVEIGAIYGLITLICSSTGGICSGFASDALTRRWRLGGRVLIPLIALPVEIAALTVFSLADNVTVLLCALAVTSFTGVFIGSSFHPAVQDLFPNQLRGRAAALISVVGNVMGVAFGPTAVALVTDRVFHDEMMLQKSMAVVGLSAAIVSFVVAVALPRLYARARQADFGAMAPPESPAGG
jgi:MFS family permease